MRRTAMSGKPVLQLAIGRAAGFAATFAVPLVLARMLAPAAFGTYKQLFLVASTVISIAQIGMVESLLYFLPASSGRGGRYVCNTSVVLAGVALVCLVLLVLAGPRLGSWFANDELRTLSGLLGIYVLLMLPSLLLEIVLTARKRYAGAAAAYAGSDVARAIAVVVPIVLTGRLEGLLIGAVGFAAARLAATLIYLGREFGSGLRPDAAAARAQLAYALPYQVGVMLSILVTNFHLYAVGCLQIPLVELVFTPAGNVMMVRMTGAIASQQPHTVLALWHDTTRRLAYIFFPLVGLLVVTAHELIVVLFTEAYVASVPIFSVWAAAILFAAFQTDGVLRVYAQTRTIAGLYAVQLLLMAGLVPTLMSAFGLVGAVLATVIAAGVGKGLALIAVRRLMSVTVQELLPRRSLLEIFGAAFLAALVALGVKNHLAVAPPLLLVITTGAYGAMYAGLLLARGFIGGEVLPVVASNITGPEAVKRSTEVAN